MPLDRHQHLVDLADLDELVREVDRLCERHDWDGLLRLRALCRAALERGRQLWPIATLIEHRVALEAPGPWAARVLEPGAGHLGIGPLAEVAASTHTWSELAPHVQPTPIAGLAAHERVVRGEIVDPATVAVPVLDLPLRLAEWEPDYPVATYSDHGVDAPRPPLPLPRDAPIAAPARRLPDDESVRALLDAVRTWTVESNGRAAAVVVEGEVRHAVAALGVARLRLAVLRPAEAIAVLSWAAASGGAHGRRRGMAKGRFDAWWAATALCGRGDAWPPDPADLGAAVGELRWYWWDAAEPDTGWSLRLGIEDPVDGLAWAIGASDAA